MKVVLAGLKSQGVLYVNSSRQVTIVAENLFGVEIILDNVKANEELGELEGYEVLQSCLLLCTC